MTVVSNASPIINLAVVGQLDLLRRLYGRVLIPEAVRNEVVVVGAGQPCASEVVEADWIQSRVVLDRTIVVSLHLEIDQGEAEAIALAVELCADLILLDERRGRIVASRLGLRTVGLLGVLVEAKHKALIPAVKPIMDGVIRDAGFWIAKDLYDRVLCAVGE